MSCAEHLSGKISGVDGAAEDAVGKFSMKVA